VASQFSSHEQRLALRKNVFRYSLNLPAVGEIIAVIGVMGARSEVSRSGK
jgi:hypothetical protein